MANQGKPRTPVPPKATRPTAGKGTPAAKPPAAGKMPMASKQPVAKAPAAGKAPLAGRSPATVPSKAIRKVSATDQAAQRALELEAQAKRSADLKAAQAKAASAPAPAVVKHTVVSGETLSHISDKYYKTPNRWKEIYEANKQVIGPDAGKIKPGQELVIPGATK